NEKDKNKFFFLISDLSSRKREIEARVDKINKDLEGYRKIENLLKSLLGQEMRKQRNHQIIVDLEYELEVLYVEITSINLISQTNSPCMDITNLQNRAILYIKSIEGFAVLHDSNITNILERISQATEDGGGILQSGQVKMGNVEK
ncbi:MAG: hypothetical protein PHE25_04775, partial [Candidatus Gracilibacteria bacterium]|nr:hypothetical protein [Candidatus Gracilibacteria bacterium]